jgi:CheY-like chemotaxis protein
LKKQQNNLTEVEILRQKAKELLKNKSPKTTSINFEAKILKLFHELEVYQIELEMQNKELLQVKEQAEIEAQKYTELYVCSEDNQIKNLKILVVEDDETSHFLLTRTLQKISYEVLHAITGVEAV